MSYSFTVKAKGRKDAKNLVSAELRKVVEAQAIHENDVDVAEEAVGTLLQIVDEPGEGLAYQVQVSGSLSWSADDVFTGANLSVSISTVQSE